MNGTMIASWIIVLFMIVPLKKDLFSCGCARAEYEIKKQCCPMCAPGNHVYWHCTDDTSTTCVPCPEYTFINEPNGQMKCFPCTVCDTSRGLRVNKACSRSSDTLCVPLERFYCIDKKESSCTSALPHSECKPGQYIKQAGTSSTDTICADCTEDTYSNGSFSSCLPHKKCEDTGLTETNPGTLSSDTECGNPSTSSTVIAISIIVVLVLITAAIVSIFKYIQKKKQSKSSEIQEAKNSEENISQTLVCGGRKNNYPDTLEEQVKLDVTTQREQRLNSKPHTQ